MLDFLIITRLYWYIFHKINDIAEKNIGWNISGLSNYTTASMFFIKYIRNIPDTAEKHQWHQLTVLWNHNSDSIIRNINIIFSIGEKAWEVNCRKYWSHESVIQIQGMARVWPETAKSARSPFNSSSPRQNGRHFADDIFKGIFMNEKFPISIQNSLKFVPKGLIDNKSALVRVMAWRQTCDRLLSEPRLT